MSWRLFLQICIHVGGLAAVHYFMARDPSFDDVARGCGSIVPVLLGYRAGPVGLGSRSMGSGR